MSYKVIFLSDRQIDVGEEYEHLRFRVLLQGFGEILLELFSRLLLVFVGIVRLVHEAHGSEHALNAIERGLDIAGTVGAAARVPWPHIREAAVDRQLRRLAEMTQ